MLVAASVILLITANFKTSDKKLLLRQLALCICIFHTMILTEVVGGGKTFLLPWKTKEITVNFSINDFVTFNGNESSLLSHHKN